MLCVVVVGGGGGVHVRSACMTCRGLNSRGGYEDVERRGREEMLLDEGCAVIQILLDRCRRYQEHIRS